MGPRSERRWIRLTLTRAELRDALGLGSDAFIVTVWENDGPHGDKISFTIWSPHLPEVGVTAAVQSVGLKEAQFETKPRSA